ncbi:transducin family protein / WD-40 repeat family protein isoform X2 [Wolffia australiana]
MAPSNIKDLLTAFSPRSEYFAISSGDGRVKVWDTLKGHLQTEFSNIVSNETSGSLFPKSNERGHLSLDYKCMQWVQLGNKKKRKSGNLLLVLGTGSGDVLALDVSSGTIKWKVNDCHPGGVSSVAFSKQGYIYTGGVDGTICQLDVSSGNLLGKLQAFTRAVSSLAISPDGSKLAAAASQLKVFNCSDNKKIQKFSGHPVGVRCITFSDNGKYILSAGIGEKFIALWKINGKKKQSATCVLSMKHPPIYLTSKLIDSDKANNSSFCVLALSETGLCYYWQEKTPEELKFCKPSKISTSIDQDNLSSILSAKIQGVLSPASVMILFACGSVVKPVFEKSSVEVGVDVNFSGRHEGVLLPSRHSSSSGKELSVKVDVTSLDRANAEDATMPIAKFYDSQEKKRKSLRTDTAEFMNESSIYTKDESRSKGDEVTLCLEERLKSAGILCDGNEIKFSKPNVVTSLTPDHGNDPYCLVGTSLPAKKVKSIVLSMSPPDALKILEALLIMWRARSVDEKLVLPWISCILVCHGHFIASRGSSFHLLSTLSKMSGAKSAAIRSLLQLSGRLQLFSTQAGSGNTNKEPEFNRADESDVEDDDVDDVIYGADENMSESSSDDEDDGSEMQEL